MLDVLQDFLNSNFFIALVTFFVGLGAYITYILQRRDRKREAANIILLEIQGAERKLKEIRKSLRLDPPSLPNDLRLLSIERWNTYNYLFINDFDRDEWDSITDFYNKCQLIDETIRYNNASFWNDVEQIRSNKQRVIADLAANTTKNLTGTIKNVTKNDEKKIKLFDDLTEKFDKIYMGKQGRFSYTPNKTVDDARLYIDEINLQFSQSNTGAKLKKIANIQSGSGS